jgi:hypothetical protein
LEFKKQIFAISNINKKCDKKLLNEKNINKIINKICKNNNYEYMILKIDDPKENKNIIFTNNDTTKNMINQLL